MEKKSKSIRKISQLVEAGYIEPNMQEALEKVVDRFSMSITSQIVDLIHSSPNDDKKALLKQFLPSAEELNVKEEELSDPIGDSVHAKVKGIIHRYPDRCLLLPVTTCPIYCRFCFRRELVGTKGQTLSSAELQNAYDYINEHTKIWEIIITGGDPFILKPKKLGEMINALNAIKHIEVIRFHTRIPVVDSARITDEMLNALQQTDKAVYVMININHPSEFTEAVREASIRLIRAGISLLSQTVLLKGINDDVNVLGELMRILVKNRIKPYYLHHSDLAQGTSHFRTTIRKGQQLMKELRGRYSGLCQPTYVLDVPGGRGKVPINHCYIHEEEKMDGIMESYKIENYLGDIYNYKDCISGD